MKKSVVLAASGALAVLAAAFLMIDGRAKKIFASDTVVNEMDVSGMTKEDLEEQIKGYSITVSYWDEQGEKVSESISGADFGMTLGDNTEAVSQILNQQGVWEYLAGEGDSYQLDDLIQYDKEKLLSEVEKLACFGAEQVIEPENAYIAEYSSTDGYQIVEETAGNIIDEQRAQKLILDAVQGMAEEIDLSEENCYQKAAITSENKKLNRTLEQLNIYAGAKITYQFDSKKEILDGETISKWLKVDKKGKVTLQKEKVSKYVAKLRRKYDTIFSSRKFKTSYGKTVTVNGGDYGWWMNSQKEEKELLRLIKAGKRTKRTPEYFQTAKSYGKNDYGDTYIEINLATQHVFLYVKGKKILETDCVTGNSSRGYDTPAGTYSITYTERNATLNGENYSTPVKYWMPFNRNIGLHDADWRSSFGGEIYKYNGSHGCVNLPPDKAAKLFKYVKKGMPVICYSYIPKKSADKDSAKDSQAKSAVKSDNSTQKNNQTSSNNDRTVKKNSSAEQKNSASKKNNSTEKNSSTSKKSSSTEKKNSTSKKNSSTEKKNSTPKKSSSTEKNSSASKKSSSTEKNSSTSKKSSSTEKNSSASKKNSSTAKKDSTSKKDNQEVAAKQGR